MTAGLLAALVVTTAPAGATTPPATAALGPSARGAATAASPGTAAAGGCGAIPAPGPTAPAAVAAPVSSPTVQVPRDEAPHTAPVEWWYFSGHLRGTPAGQVRCYGFEYVTFQVIGFAPVPAYVADLAVTDLSRRTFHYDAQTSVLPVPATKGSFSLYTGAWTMSGGSGRDTLRAGLPGYSFDLHLQATEPAVLEGNDGVVSLGGLGTSKYYSWTSLLTTGALVDHGVNIKVSGLSWMDHQWGQLDLTEGGGWDWFSVQLTNGQQYMFYFIRDGHDRIVSSFGTHIGSAGRTVRLSPVAETATGTWHSPVTGTTYGSGWRVALPGGYLDVTPDLVDQELNLRSTQGNAYWEGDVSVHGQIAGAAVTGTGYTELNPPGATTPVL